MKKIKFLTVYLLSVLVFLTGCESEPESGMVTGEFVDAADLVSHIRIGWNLGNTLDAHPEGNRMHRNPTVQQQEQMWGNPITTEQMILDIQEAGFNTLRVPVTFYTMMDAEFNIREEWMERVVTVVNYGYDNGMIVIVNTHHDEYIFSLFDDEMDESIVAIGRLWEQLADTFRDHSQRLVFEGLNEPRTIGSELEWAGGTAEERANVNVLNQLFVDTVRASGGNNEQRLLMVPTYAAAVNYNAINDFVLPNDPMNEENRLIVSLHMYSPYAFALHAGGNSVRDWSEDDPESTGSIIWGLDLAYETFVSRGIPVIMGEMAAINRDNLESRVAWTYFYVREARARGISCIWWDNGMVGITAGPGSVDHFGLYNRRSREFPFPEIIDAMLRATE